MSSAMGSGGTTNYVYNALGQLIEKSGNGGTALLMYDEAGHILGEYSSTGALIEETIWMGDLPVATLQPNGSSVAIYYIHSDHLGTPRKVTRPSDNGLMWRWDPDTFGSLAPNANPAGLGNFTYNLRYPGMYDQGIPGPFINNFRNYVSLIGSYLQSDPIGLAGGSYSTYAYVLANPISNFDPLGLYTLEQLVSIIYNETAPLHGVGIDSARVDLAYVLQNRYNNGDTGRVASDALNNQAVAAIANGVPSAVDAYLGAIAAASRAIECPNGDPTHGARGFNLRGNSSFGPRNGDLSNPDLIHFGPFDNRFPTIGNPNVKPSEQLPASGVYANFYLH